MSDVAQLPVRFDDDGLVPVVVQDGRTGDVLMLAFMSEDALRLTQETGRAHYWSRSRNRLWKKGETSGNVQLVDEIRVNCERNSLLLRVRQVGAVCHDGYPTCYYRRVEPDGSLRVVSERSFDPAIVYGAAAPAPAEPTEADDPLADATRRQFGAYAFLRDNDLEAVSSTSRRLRAPDADLQARLAGELRELAGVIDGTHQHGERAHDLCLEGSQVIYWLLLLCLREGLTWATLRPDHALAQGEADASSAAIADRLRAEAKRWEDDQTAVEQVAARARPTLTLVGQACGSGDVAPLAVIEADLRDLSSRSYLAPYFARQQP
jgi:phosphoribosyl-AMP cyclohydrolase